MGRAPGSDLYGGKKKPKNQMPPLNECVWWRCPCAQSEVEETLKRISSHKGVHGILIVNVEGVPIRSTLDPALVRSPLSRCSCVCPARPVGSWGSAELEGHVSGSQLSNRRLLGPLQTTSYASHITAIAAKARSVIRDLDPTNDLTFLRLRSKKHEIMVAPGASYRLLPLGLHTRACTHTDGRFRGTE